MGKEHIYVGAVFKRYTNFICTQAHKKLSRVKYYLTCYIHYMIMCTRPKVQVASRKIKPGTFRKVKRHYLLYAVPKIIYFTPPFFSPYSSLVLFLKEYFADDCTTQNVFVLKNARIEVHTRKSKS